jgi:hypothetical protein
MEQCGSDTAGPKNPKLAGGLGEVLQFEVRLFQRLAHALRDTLGWLDLREPHVHAAEQYHDREDAAGVEDSFLADHGDALRG